MKFIMTGSAKSYTVGLKEDLFLLASFRYLFFECCVSDLWG